MYPDQATSTGSDYTYGLRPLDLARHRLAMRLCRLGVRRGGVTARFSGVLAGRDPVAVLVILRGMSVRPGRPVVKVGGFDVVGGGHV